MKTARIRIALACALLSPSLCLPALAAKGDYIMYVGTYTNQNSKSQGIYAWRFNANSGKLEALGLAGETSNPSFVAIHPNKRYLYSVTEAYNVGGQPGGAVSAFSIDQSTGKLTLLNKVSSKGGGPCYVIVDKTGRNVLVANYGTGSVASLPVNPDGSLGEATSVIQHKGQGADPKRQGGPHAHSINPSPDNRFAIAADLGLDEVLVYRFDPMKGSLEPNNPPFTKIDPASGPRHFVFHPTGKYAYVINEMKQTVTGFQYDKERGVLTAQQTISTLPAGTTVPGNSTAEVRVHPSGKFLYGSNRGHDSIAVFSIDGKGMLKLIGNTPTEGKVPRNFNLDPTGKWLFAANQNSGSIVLFKVDAKTGRLTPAGQKLEVGAPVCIRFLDVQ